MQGPTQLHRAEPGASPVQVLLQASSRQHTTSVNRGVLNLGESRSIENTT
jgi:hypothetical protein